MVESVLFSIVPICQRYDLADRMQTLAGDAAHDGFAPSFLPFRPPARPPESCQTCVQHCGIGSPAAETRQPIKFRALEGGQT